MADYPALGRNLLVDPQGRRVFSVSGKMMRGTVSPNDPDEANTHVILVDALENPLAVARGVSAAATRILAVGGRAEATTPIAVTDDQMVGLFLDLLGQLAVRPKDATGADLFPAAAALADDAANPTLTKIASYLMGFDGTTWDRLRGDAANGLDVDVTRLPNTGIFAGCSVFDAGSATGSGGLVGATTGLRLMGYSVAEDAGSPATASFKLRNGTTAGGDMRVYEKLAASQSKTVWFGPEGLACGAGIFLERVSGTTHVLCYHKTVS